MKNILETTRLTVHEFTPDDAPFILNLLNTKGWLEFIGDRHVHNTTDALNYLRQGPFNSYTTHGFGLWKVSMTTTQQPIGMCGLIQRDYLPSVDIGFAFLPEFAKQGYATEAAHGVIEYAQKQLHLHSVMAIVMPENQHSIRLLEKIGLRFRNMITPPNSNETLMLFDNDK